VNIGIFLKIEDCEGGLSFIRVNTVSMIVIVVYCDIVPHRMLWFGRNINFVVQLQQGILNH
jgi:hypothetical protein